MCFALVVYGLDVFDLWPTVRPLHASRHLETAGVPGLPRVTGIPLPFRNMAPLQTPPLSCTCSQVQFEIVDKRVAFADNGTLIPGGRGPYNVSIVLKVGPEGGRPITAKNLAVAQQGGEGRVYGSGSWTSCLAMAPVCKSDIVGSGITALHKTHMAW